MTIRAGTLALALTLALATAGCARGDNDQNGSAAGPAGSGAATAALVPVTIAGASGSHVFRVESARTGPQQEQGLMYRTDLKPDGGMLFWPYPPNGGAPREASFWMKNTPSPLDIVFIRPDGTIAHIADNTVPFSETPIPSGEPVAAVLEVPGGRTADLGIAEGDRVSWPGAAFR